MLKVEQVIVVEGRYDKNTLSQVVDATIIETEGFGVFSDKEKLALLRRMADKKGLIVFTDSDSAGFLIRNFIKSSIDNSKVRHAYIPDIYGKEKRKKEASAEGKLGVEGMSAKVILQALERAEAGFSDSEGEKITKADMYKAGLSGCPGCSARRAALIKRLELPERLSPNALLDVLNALMTREEFLSLVRDVT